MTVSPTLPSVELERSDDLFELARVDEGQVRFVHVPEVAFFAVDGTEAPGSDVYMTAIRTLFQIAHELKEALLARGAEGRIGHLEGLYWFTSDDIMEGKEPDRRSDPEGPLRWRLLVAVPPDASEVEVEAAIRRAAERDSLPLLERLHVVHWEEGPVAQVLHVGPYMEETQDVRRLHAAISAAGYEAYGQHHEIYLNNPQKAGQEDALTVLRRPIRWADASEGA